MSVINALRSRPGVIALGAEAPGAFTVRVQMPEVWDVVAVRCAPDTSVGALKRAAFDAFGQIHHPVEDYVMKLRGFEVVNEAAPIAAAGAREGSTFLLTCRYRRPVR